jgi:hypothetical protein
MSIGKDSDILKRVSKREKPTSRKGGRPKVNRDLVIRLLKSMDQIGTPRYSYSQIARMAKCSTKTVTRIRDEALENGDLETDERLETALSTIEADFDDECQRATGYSFYEWVTNQTKSGKYVFNFSEKVWSSIWEGCSLVDVYDRDHPIGDQICLKFLEVFGEDRERIRDRKKKIRYLFRYLGRQDLCDRHLRMTNSRDPRAVRRVPEISMIDFPKKLELCWDHMETVYPAYGKFIIQFKLCTQMRTGSRPDERELWGIKKGSEGKSYLLMSSPDEYRCHIFAKKSEEWDVIWLPRDVRVKMWDLYNRVDMGEPLLKGVNVSKFRKEWAKITEKVFGRPLSLHDIRKASITWLYVIGVPLEIATVLNVGWKDLSTARDHYLEIRKLLRASTKEKYSDNIPDWYKEGLGEFTGDTSFDFVIDSASPFMETGHR